MESLFNTIKDYFMNCVSQYSFFIEWDYYKGLFSKYFSFLGFIIGFVFVLLIYFSSDEAYDDRMINKAGIFKILPIIAVINSCTVLTQYVDSTFGQGFGYGGGEAAINSSDNIFSAFILTLVVISCYRNFGGRAFLFGLVTHASIPMLNFSYFKEMNLGVPVLHMIIRIVLVGFICAIVSHRKYFFTGWIWYFVFHMLLRVAVLFLPLLSNNLNGFISYKPDYSLNIAIEYFSHFAVDIVAFFVILAFSIVFEKKVITAKLVKATA